MSLKFLSLHKEMEYILNMVQGQCFLAFDVLMGTDRI